MPKVKLSIHSTVCKGCALCITACPKAILSIDKNTINPKGYRPAICIDARGCTACAVCAIICPDSAITVERETA